MTGQGHIIHLFSKACRNEPFTSGELSIGNLTRHNIIPLLDDSYQPGPEIAHQIVKRTTSDAIPTDPLALSAPSRCTWTYFTFSTSSLRALKALATSSISSGYISTDDALSAFIWQSIIRARRPRLSPTIKPTFARAVDPRRFLGIPQTYPGLVQNMTYNTATLQKLVEEPLGAVASDLRSALNPQTSNLGYNTRALATILSRNPDKNTVSVTASLDLSVDLMLSSWAQVKCYELDFGLGLRKPEAVRRPRFDAVESLIYLMPKTLDGEIAVAVCLREEDLERLRTDVEWVRYAREVG